MQFDVVSDEPNLPAELLSSEALTVLLDTLGTGQYAQATRRREKLFRLKAAGRCMPSAQARGRTHLLAQYRCAVSCSAVAARPPSTATCRPKRATERTRAAAALRRQGAPEPGHRHGVDRVRQAVEL